MNVSVNSDDLRMEGLDVENIDLGVIGLSSNEVIDLGMGNLETGIPGPPMRIERDKNDPTLWNLVDWRGRTHGSIPVPLETHVTSAVYDDTFKQITFNYNTESGKQSFTCDLSRIKTAIKAGNGLSFENGELSLVIDPQSHKALSVSDKGLKLDGSYFADSKNELFLSEYSEHEYVDY